MSRAPVRPKEDMASARRLLQRLTEQEVTLRRVGGCYRLMRQSTQQGALVPESLISLCMRHDWLTRDGQDLVCQTRAGRRSVAMARAPTRSGTSIRSGRQAFGMSRAFAGT